MTRQDDFFRAVTNRNIVRVRVAGIVVHDERLLVQRPTDEPDSCYALIGGEYEVGDTFESRLRAEFEEETNARVIRSEYLFVVENRFLWNGKPFHGVEHYLGVELDRYDVESREPHLSQHWLPLDTLSEQDLRPHVVRDVIASGAYRSIRNLNGWVAHGSHDTRPCPEHGLTTHVQGDIEMAKHAYMVIYFLLMIVIIVGADVLFLRDHFVARLMVNIAIVVVFAAVYFVLLRKL